MKWERPELEATMREVVRILSGGLPPDPPSDSRKAADAGRVDVDHQFCYLREFAEEEDESTIGGGDADDGDEDDERRRR